MSVESEGPVDPVFRVKFLTRSFDFGAQQGLGVEVGKSRRVIAISYKSSPALVAESLRELADWIAAQPETTA